MPQQSSAGIMLKLGLKSGNDVFLYGRFLHASFPTATNNPARHPNYLAFSGLPYGAFWLAKRPIRQCKTAVVVWPYGPNLTQERTGPTTNIIPDITQCRHAGMPINRCLPTEKPICQTKQTPNAPLRHLAGAGSPRQYATDYIN